MFANKLNADYRIKGSGLIFASIILSSVTFLLIDLLYMVVENPDSYRFPVVTNLFILYSLTAIILLPFLLLFFFPVLRKFNIPAEWFFFSSLSFLFSGIQIAVYLNAVKLLKINSNKGFILHILILTMSAMFFSFPVILSHFYRKPLKRIFPLIFIVPVFIAICIYLIVGRGGQETGTQGENLIFKGKPDIIFVLIDTLRADHLSCYNYTKETSPFIDKMAKEGVLFENNFTQACWTKPSTASIFTSLYPSQHNALVLNDRVPERALTLPEYLKKTGYHTALFSANANVSPEMGFGQGVDYFFNTHKMSMSDAGLMNQFFKKYFPVFHRICNVSGKKSADTGYLDIELNRQIERYLEGLDDAPLFLYIHYNSPHNIYSPPEPYRFMFQPDDKKPVIDVPQKSLNVFEPGPILSERDHLSLIASYDGEIRYVDSIIENLFNILEKSRNIQNNIVIITSDHGEAFYEHSGWEHSHSLYNELLHVPLIIKAPCFDADLRINSYVRSIDIFPTILSLAEISVPDGLMGKSLINGPNLSEIVYSELITRGYEGRSLIMNEIKYSEYFYGNKIKKELFFLSDDPAEKENMYNEHAEVRKMYFEKLQNIVEKISEGTLQPEKVILDEETKESLKALGYIN